MTDFNLRAARLQLYGLLAAVLLAALLAAGITTGAFILSFSVLKDLAVQGMLPAEHAWIFPAIVDGGILGATIAVIVLSKISGSAKGRNFFLCLLIAVVFVSVAGNAYHAYRAAQDAAQTIAEGTILGFNPLAPTVAPIIAVIPPLLVLAFTHGIGILIKAIGSAFTEYSELVKAADATSTSVAAPDDIAGADPRAAATSAPTIAWTSTEPTEPGPVTKTDEWSSAAAVASERTPVAHDVALIAHDVAPVAHDVAPVAHHVASVAPEGTPSPTPETVVADDIATAPIVETAPAPEQSTRALLEFIDQVPGLSEEVRETARMKIRNPDLTFAAIAEQTGGVATSTALRRYNKAAEAALKVGFTMPPLPDLGEGSLGREHVEERELVTS
ncbi:DUF2637 domain-containing protein [Rhodococcus pyridinivorans]|uniref:DUF2637 domain-containing protein n=1 Tax=Rhodococcus pyridinivorans TaxID=103816 RepID=UPI001E48C434|nr:DUF2637 domain-containing protein [Rhodococcus pyridinivorans]MCD5422528.1 DUF2637 domain-containing protein [Rhodococcus pyridinivorans]